MHEITGKLAPVSRNVQFSESVEEAEKEGQQSQRRKLEKSQSVHVLAGAIAQQNLQSNSHLQTPRESSVGQNEDSQRSSGRIPKAKSIINTNREKRGLKAIGKRGTAMYLPSKHASTALTEGTQLLERRTAPFVFDPSKPLLKYTSECQVLKRFIDQHFKDCDLINYDREHQLADRENTSFDHNSLQAEFREEGLKIWNFLAENVILRESLIHNRYQNILKKKSLQNLTAYNDIKNAEAAAAKEEFKRQLRQNEQLLHNQPKSSGDLIIGREEAVYNQTRKRMQEQMIAYVKDMKKRGYLGDKEIQFLKQGIMFYTVKLAMFGMRPDDIMERKQLIKEGRYHQMKSKRPGSASSMASSKASPSARLLKRNNPQYATGQSSNTNMQTPTDLGSSSFTAAANAEAASAQKQRSIDKQKLLKMTKMEMAKASSKPSKDLQYINRVVAKLRGKKQYNISKSPTKKYIEENFHDPNEEFNINKTLRWDSYNTRLYSLYASKQFEECEVMLNIMTMDRQIQNLEDNYRLVRKIRDDDKVFNEIIEYLRKNFVLISNQANVEIRKLNPKVRVQVTRKSIGQTELVPTTNQPPQEYQTQEKMKVTGSKISGQRSVSVQKVHFTSSRSRQDFANFSIQKSKLREDEFLKKLEASVRLKGGLNTSQSISIRPRNPSQIITSSLEQQHTNLTSTMEDDAAVLDESQSKEALAYVHPQSSSVTYLPTLNIGEARLTNHISIYDSREFQTERPTYILPQFKNLKKNAKADQALKASESAKNYFPGTMSLKPDKQDSNEFQQIKDQYHTHRIRSQLHLQQGSHQNQNLKTSQGIYGHDETKQNRGHLIENMKKDASRSTSAQLIEHQEMYQPETNRSNKLSSFKGLRVQRLRQLNTNTLSNSNSIGVLQHHHQLVQPVGGPKKYQQQQLYEQRYKDFAQHNPNLTKMKYSGNKISQNTVYFAKMNEDNTATSTGQKTQSTEHPKYSSKFSLEDATVPVWSEVDPVARVMLKSDMTQRDPINNIFLKRKLSQKNTNETEKFLKKYKARQAKAQRPEVGRAATVGAPEYILKSSQSRNHEAEEELHAPNGQMRTQPEQPNAPLKQAGGEPDRPNQNLITIEEGVPHVAGDHSFEQSRISFIKDSANGGAHPSNASRGSLPQLPGHTQPSIRPTAPTARSAFKPYLLTAPANTAQDEHLPLQPNTCAVKVSQESAAAALRGKKPAAAAFVGTCSKKKDRFSVYKNTETFF